MIVYEVNLFVQRAIEAEFRPWLDAHISEMLALPGFIDASVFECVEPAADAGEFALCVHYRLTDETALADYLRDHAPRMRNDGLARFGASFRAARRVLRPVASADHSGP